VLSVYADSGYGVGLNQLLDSQCITEENIEQSSEEIHRLEGVEDFQVVPKTACQFDDCDSANCYKTGIMSRGVASSLTTLLKRAVSTSYITTPTTSAIPRTLSTGTPRSTVMYGTSTSIGTTTIATTTTTSTTQVTQTATTASWPPSVNELYCEAAKRSDTNEGATPENGTPQECYS